MEKLDNRIKTRDEKILSLLNRMKMEFEKPIKLNSRASFNQRDKVEHIDLYLNSLFKNMSEAKAQELGKQFFNVLDQSLKNAIVKTDIDRKDIIIEIKDKIISFLLNAANVEFMDDVEMGNIINEIIKSYYKYGTVIVKTVSDKKIEVVELKSIIWDQADYNTKPIVESNVVPAYRVVENSLYSTDELEKYLDNKADYDIDLTQLKVYEINGVLEKNLISLVPTDKKRVWQRHIVCEVYGESGSQRFVIYSGLLKENPYDVLRRFPIKGRSLGYGLIESLLQAQIAVNEAVNIQADDLRAAKKSVWFTDDDALGGLNLSEVDNNVVINGEKKSRFEKLNTQAYAFAPAQSYLHQWVGQSKEQSKAMDAALGSNVVSGEAYRARQLTINQIDNNFDYDREVIGLFISSVYKKKWLKLLIDRFNTKKAVDDLLTGEQLNDYYNYVATLLSSATDQINAVNGINPQDDTKEYILNYIKENNDVVFNWTGVEVSESDIIDKAKVLITNEQLSIQNKIETLKVIAQQYFTNPQAYPNIDIKEVLNELVNLSDKTVLVDLSKETRSLPVQTQQNDLLPSNNLEKDLPSLPNQQ